MGDYPNGRFPDSALAYVPGTNGHRAIPSAAEAMGRVIALARADGVVMADNRVMTDSYRDYDTQVALRKRWCDRGKCNYAAFPGTSNHGLGQAFDCYPALHIWIRNNLVLCREHGIIWPEWARPPGVYEPWHMEYVVSLDRHRGESPIEDEDEMTLIRGMTGNEVKVLQWRLQHLGFLDPDTKDDDGVLVKPVQADGIFGAGTEAAVKAFQVSVGFVQTGQWDWWTNDRARSVLDSR